jgi:hypothetical protein
MPYLSFPKHVYQILVFHQSFKDVSVSHARGSVTQGYTANLHTDDISVNFHRWMSMCGYMIQSH